MVNMVSLLLLQADVQYRPSAGQMFTAILVPAVVVVVSVFFPLWALISAIRNPQLQTNTKLLWVIVIIIGNFIGALLYLCMRPKRA